MHETIQEWLRIMYEESIKASDDFKINTYFQDRLLFNYKKEKAENDNQHFSTHDELMEFYDDGVAILQYLKAKKRLLFDTKNMELIAIEMPLYTSIFDNNDKFVFQGFLDLVFWDKINEGIDLPDIKTSTRGWSKYQKADEVKQQQILLYKHYFAKQMGMDVSKVDGKYLILKRKIWEEAEYPQARLQTHIPAQAERTVKKAVDSLEKFILDCYHPDGTPIEKVYEKFPGSACKFCPFNQSPDLCNQKK